MKLKDLIEEYNLLIAALEDLVDLMIPSAPNQVARATYPQALHNGIRFTLSVSTQGSHDEYHFVIPEEIVQKKLQEIADRSK